MQRLIVYGKHNFSAEESDEISFKAGEPIIVLEKDENFGDGWWTGQNMNGDVGIFPMNFVTVNDTPNSAKSNLDMLLEDLETVEFPDDNVYQWDSSRVAEFISSIGFEDLKHLFIEHDVDGLKLLDSTIASLRKIGVDVLSSRVKIMHEIITLKETHKKDNQSDTTEILEIDDDTTNHNQNDNSRKVQPNADPNKIQEQRSDANRNQDTLPGSKRYQEQRFGSRQDHENQEPRYQIEATMDERNQTNLVNPSGDVKGQPPPSGQDHQYENQEIKKSNIDSVIRKYELLPDIIPEPLLEKEFSISPTKEEQILDSQIRLSDQMINGMAQEVRYSDPLSEEHPPDVAYSDTSSQDIPRMTNLSESEFDFEFEKTLEEIKLTEMLIKQNLIKKEKELKDLPLIPEEDPEIHEEIEIMDMYAEEKTTSLNINAKMSNDFKFAPTPVKQKRSRKLSLRKESNAIPVPQFDDSNLRAYLYVKAESELMFHRKKCILKGSSIYVFKKDDQQISQIVHMNDPSSILPSEKPNSFMIKDTINQTKTIFTCSSQLEMISWVNKLVRATQPPIHKAPLIPIKNANRGHLKDGIMGKTVKLQEIKRPTSFMGKAKFMPERYKRYSMEE
ncbi:polar growth protein [Boothiomyces sp. JEL0866]|nr:polar growth protein [Boothiomyces sp. JEL0866]